MNDHERRRELGAYIRRCRESLGLTVRGLARAAGVDATGISRLERGDNDAPEPRTLARLAKALGVDVTDLYVLAGYPVSQGLPAFQPYLRARYDLTPEEVEQLAAHFQLMLDRRERQKGGSGGSHDYPAAA